MQLEIFQGDKKPARLEVGPGNEIKFFEQPDEKLGQFVVSCLAGGITQLRDVYDPKTKTFVMIEEPVGKNNPLFPLALKQFLSRKGYKVVEKHPETEQKIRKLLADFPDDNPDRIEILKRLPQMGNLEQTFILEALK